MDTAVEIAMTKDRFREMVVELQGVAEKLDDQSYLDHTLYCDPNGSRFGNEVQIHFSNDDMEAHQNPDIDPSKILVSIDRV